MTRTTTALTLSLAASVFGCATVQPFTPSAGQTARFDGAVRQVEALGVTPGSGAAELLAEAKSEFEYSQHLPKYPERARELAAKAQRDAEAALRLARAPVPAATPRIAAQPIPTAEAAPEAPPPATDFIPAGYDHQPDPAVAAAPEASP